MRTTLDIEADILVEARALAAARRVSLGRVVSELARKGLAGRTDFAIRDGMPVFEARPDEPVMTSAQVQELMADER